MAHNHNFISEGPEPQNRAHKYYGPCEQIQGISKGMASSKMNPPATPTPIFDYPAFRSLYFEKTYFKLLYCLLWFLDFIS